MICYCKLNKITDHKLIRGDSGGYSCTECGQVVERPNWLECHYMGMMRELEKGDGAKWCNDGPGLCGRKI